LGGGERYTASFAKLLLDKNWQVDINWSDPDLTEKLQSRFGLNLSGCRFVREINTEDYQLTFWVSDGSLPMSFSKKTIIHLQFPFTGVGGGSLTNWLKSRFYTFVVNSRFTKSFIDREYHIDSRVIYPPVDTTGFKAGEKQNLILYTGRFSKLTQRKGQQVLVDVFKKISPQLRGWQLVLAGGTAVGTEPAEMQALKNSTSGFPIKIIIDPTYAELKKLMGSAKIFWSASGYGVNEKSDPTRVEHFGITVVEAMAAGAVPLVTNLGGHKEIISKGQDGYLWDTPDELADITQKLVADSKQQASLSRQAITKSKMFNIDHFNAAFSSLLKL
jgi:glycosyltransferase involved in cell wall biosynthesis